MKIDTKIAPEKVEGTGLFRTIIVLEILSDESVANMGLEDIARNMYMGDISGRYEILDEREIGQKDMAQALRAQDSDPEFLLGEQAWVYDLHSGDEVIWNDPDEGACSKTITISTIEFHGKDIVRITDKNGDFLECHIDELS